MSTGRKYIEKMVEGITTLDLSGDLNVTGDTALAATLYKKTVSAQTSDFSPTNADSGTVYGIVASGVTASLPDSNSNGGVHYTFVMLGTGLSVMLSNSVGDSHFLGAILGSTTGSDAGAPVHANGTSHGQIQSVSTVGGDTFTVMSTGLGNWVLINTNTYSPSQYTPG